VAFLLRNVILDSTKKPPQIEAALQLRVEKQL